MTVLCANCHTANRDRAMFCIGCAGKLPAFAATGPSALQTAGTAPTGGKSRAGPRGPSGDRRTAAHAGHAPRGLMLAVLLLGATVLALAAWISFGPPRAAAPGIASAAAPSQALPALQTLPATPLAAPAPVAAAPSTGPGAPGSTAGASAAAGATASAVASPTTSPAELRPASAMSAESGLAPGESMVAAPASRSVATAPGAAGRNGGNSNGEPPARHASTEPAASGPVSERVASINTARPPSRGASDPRVGCEHLFFVLAARCEANHCEEAAYSRHPRCSIVREQRRRDEARRNLTNN